ncbi:MAG: LysE family transporter [Lachnospiraceae bacterium]|nr:LysE family transporter [Lachnospiraceae bacterium]
MTLSVYFSFVAYACATTVLPGPNNVLLLASAGQFGFRRCLKLLLGIWSGLVTVMLLAGGFCSALGTWIPSIAPVFKYVGAAYILYLACKTARRHPIEITEQTGQSAERPLTYWNGFLLQFLNVKVIMLGLASYPGYFLPYGHSVWLVVLFAVTMTACCGCGNLIWSAAGSLLCRR